MIGAALGAVLVFACLLFASRPAWFPTSITAFGKQFDNQFNLTLDWAAGAFILLHILLIAAVYLRRAPGQLRHRQWQIETVWTLAVTAVFLVLTAGGVRVWAAAHLQPDSSGAERIEVYAHQFAWAFRYPGPDGKFGRTSAKLIDDVLENPFGADRTDPAGKDDLFSAALKVPAGREIILLLHSRDVIHDFFVRELRFKQDVVPGMEIPYRFRAETPGIYEIACSELCGLGHSQMRATMEVMHPQAFEQWKRARFSAATTR